MSRVSLRVLVLPVDADKAIDKLRGLGEVVNVSGPYRNRGEDRRVRFYVDLEVR